jgi:hypothetical protein
MCVFTHSELLNIYYRWYFNRYVENLDVLYIDVKYFRSTLFYISCEGRLKACSKRDEFFFFLFSSIVISSSVSVLYV